MVNLLRMLNTIRAMDVRPLRRFFLAVLMGSCLAGISLVPIEGQEKLVAIEAVGPGSQWLEAKAGGRRQLTWWFPEGASMLYLPISGGIQIDWRQRDRWPFLQHRSPWDLRELPLIGVQYGDRTLAVIIPWPHYASLVLKNRIGIRFSYPEGRNNVDPA